MAYTMIVVICHQVSDLDIYVQKEVDEIQRLTDLEKDKVEMAQQKTLNQIRTSCAKVIYYVALLFVTFPDFFVV